MWSLGPEPCEQGGGKLDLTFQADVLPILAGGPESRGFGLSQQ